MYGLAELYDNGCFVTATFEYLLNDIVLIFLLSSSKLQEFILRINHVSDSCVLLLWRVVRVLGDDDICCFRFTIYIK